MYSLYGAIPGAPIFPGMMAGMTQPPGAGGAPMPNAAPPGMQLPSQRGMSMPSMPAAMPSQQQQDPMADMSRSLMMAKMAQGQQGVPGSQLSGIPGISSADVRQFLGMDTTKYDLKGAEMPTMSKSGLPFGWGSLTTGDTKAPFAGPAGEPSMPTIMDSLGGAPMGIPPAAPPSLPMAQPNMPVMNPSMPVPPMPPGMIPPMQLPPGFPPLGLFWG